MKQIVCAAALIAATATPAVAQENTAFAGPWIGASVGYDRIGSDGDTKDGLAYGVALGYDFDFGGLIVGAEAELGESSVSASGKDVLVEGDALTLSAGRDIYAGVRLGIPLGQRLMGFVKAGYSDLRYEANYTVDDEVTEDSSTSGGYRLGVGMEVALGKPFARVEYRYSNYGSFSEGELETDRHQAMLTAGMRF